MGQDWSASNLSTQLESCIDYFDCESVKSIFLAKLASLVLFLGPTQRAK